MAILTLLPLFGEAHATSIILDGEDQKRVDFLTRSLSKPKYSTNKATYLPWGKYFDEGGEGSNSAFQVEAFLDYLLSYFVFPSSPKDGINSFVFPLVVLLSKGNRLVLALLYLGSLYAQLDECLKGVLRSVGRYDVVTYVEASFLQLFLWKRLGALSPVLVEFKPGKP